MAFLKAQKGVTLLETMLALAIAGSILVLSIKMYRQFELEANLRQLQGNVDSLFQAMSLYYKANCNGTYNNKGQLNAWGSLNPYSAAPPSLVNPLVKSIATDLLATGYLKDWQPLNPLVDKTVGEGGYIIQFNPILFKTSNTVNACTNLGVKPCTITPTPVNPLPANQVNGHYMPSNHITGLVWQLQVSVAILNQPMTTTYASNLDANCVSDLSGANVEACEKPPGGPTYWIVWERLPSNASPETSTINWISRPAENQFNLQYTHDQMYELIPGTQDQFGNTLRYYLCGG